MRAFRIITACLLSALLSGFATLNPPALAEDEPRIIHMQGGQVMLEVVGEVMAFCSAANRETQGQRARVEAKLKEGER